jgi:alpha-glucan,water dikinase
MPEKSQAKTSPVAEKIAGAYQTKFPEPDADGCRKIKVEVCTGDGLKGFQFVLHRKPNEWMKRGNENFLVDLSKLGSSSIFREHVKKALTKAGLLEDAGSDQVIRTSSTLERVQKMFGDNITKNSPTEAAGDNQTYPLQGAFSCWSCKGVEVAVVARMFGETCKVQAFVDSDKDFVLQYGLAGDNKRWLSTTRVTLEKLSGTTSVGNISLASEDIEEYLMFVLHDALHNQWLKDGGRDFALKLPPAPPSSRKKLTVGGGYGGEPHPQVTNTQSAKSPQKPPTPSEFQKFVDALVKEDPDSKMRTWNVGEIQIAVLANASEHECTVHIAVESSAELVLQYGCAGANRGWQSSKRLPLVRAKGSLGTSCIYEACLAIHAADVDAFLMFVLHDGSVNRWLKDGNRDFEVELPRHPEWDRLRQIEESRKAAEIEAAMESRKSFLAARKEREAKATITFASFVLERDCGDLDVSCCVGPKSDEAIVDIKAWLHPRLGECLLHFGVLSGSRSGKWECALDQKAVKWPEGITAVDKEACQAKLCTIGQHVQSFQFSMPLSKEKDGDSDTFEPELAGISFVLKTATGNEWFKPNNGSNATVRFSTKGQYTGPCATVANRIVEEEVMSSHMSLKKRYEVCLDIVDSWEKQSEGMVMRKVGSWSSLMQVDSSEAKWSRLPSMPLIGAPEETYATFTKENFWSWIFVWQRFSFMKLLTWEKNTCTQPRMLAGTTNAITSRMAELWKAHPRVRMWIRWTLATMGRGGSAGQQIRDEILVIMHRHNIKEIHGTYYEQWHQKLHNNTTPEDIGICRAIIAFLRGGGDMAKYWQVLHEHDITKERLASYSRPITTEPHTVNCDSGRLIADFENYLQILRSVHDALDLQVALQHAESCLPESLRNKLRGVCNMGGTGFANDDEGHAKLMKVADAREDMLAMLNKRDTQPNVIKELLVIDYTLETQQSVLIQGMTGEVRLGPLCDQLKVLVTSLVAHMPTEDELQAVLADWKSLGPDCAALKWNSPTESALLLKAMSDRMGRIVGELSDKCQSLMGPKAAWLGQQIEAPKRNIDVFVDEVLRGTSLIAVSLVLQRLEPVLRGLAHLPPWQMISTVSAPVQGELQLIDKMTHIQEKVFETPTILLSGAVSGEEEVPEGVVGVLVRSAKEAPDILSHCAVRARNFGVLLATCFDPAISAGLAQNFEGKWVEVVCKADGSLSVKETERPKTPAAGTLQAEAEDKMVSKTKVKMNLTDSLGCSWTVRPDEMNTKNVGSKSLNLALLQPKLPSDIFTPQAVALPYGCMQKALTDLTNKEDVLPNLQRVLGRLQPGTSNSEAHRIFEEAQALVEEMQMPEGLKTHMLTSLAKVGEKQGEARLKELFDAKDAWYAIKGVWASLFALRPWVSLAKAGRSFHDLNMAVLVQELVEARYAFVLHTVNPFTHDADELYGELVAGRGESLVGNYPGRALSFAMKRGGEPRLIAFPSKSVSLHTQHCLIFRSDSNGEDLEGFAGAGLFESKCAEEDAVGYIRFHRMPVVTDRSYRQKLLQRIAEAGWAIEKAFDGVPQDIEGCVDPQDRIFIVQSRPQV